ncbi:universal stress protein [Poseidonibacter lekithochrous]|uniref:universal stress protein n=1 Tax=Poseidonibacter TaxID=2321187 RepID=UPI001C0A4978|nr:MULTISPECIES: universal stress protein [Poseidonibacter]MBU3014714.1 universal stress protein [Poseidonibacter lekithochrous]MDO6828012.1 universal stress protein [Poseidonibacter sp. 1_MG-2023]
MNYRKLFFPIGGGEELKERLYGAFLIANKFNTKLDVLKCMHETNSNIYKSYSIPKNIISEIDKIIETEYKDKNEEFSILFEKIIKESKIDSSLVNLKIVKGLRSTLVEEESKFCDLVIAAAPPSGLTTATFETSVLKSGKAVLMFPRIMKTFSMNNIIIGWNNSIEASRAITSSIEILKQSQRVHIVSSSEYIKNPQMMQNLVDYLLEHEINVSYEIVKTTRIPGQALLNAALDGNFDLIVAGAYGHKGLKELMFGGATRYLLENSPIPVFMSH